MSSSAPSPPAGAPPEPPPPPEFYCYECDATVSLPAEPVAPSSARRPLCPLCHSDFIEENPSTPSPPPPPPPPPPLLFSGSSSSSLSDDPDDDFDFVMDPDEARAYLSRLVHRHRLQDDDGPFDVAAAAAVSVLQQHGPRPRPGRHGLGGGGEPPATAASIAALPTVEVAEPAAVCAICKDDLPLASEARKLPCAHLYHSFCIVTWLQMHNSCPVCRFRIPSAAAADEAAPSEQDPTTTRVTIRFTTTTRRRVRVGGDAQLAAPISASPTQLAQAITGDGAGGPANSGETVSSEWPPHPESDTVMSEAREGDAFFD
ncbi:E3 ubiquitin-protein ligase RING1-like [Miscanthus floridulus]|uniref:E3 ubiquitin-protein ligase RING1-like n=1 Tax=Miscanthus floridulus TaxID=154761 RepID=UPI00345986B0